MANYVQIEFIDISTERSEILVAELSQIGFEGFEEEENVLKAFVSEDSFNEVAMITIARQNSVYYTATLIEDKNWNHEWETNFQPVIVDDRVAIRAGFHEPVKGVELEIIITPKMSFGTGHHATTHMMVQQMRTIDFKGKKVLDFGTGTGVLAILAEKLGALSILAIDNDEWSITNAAENINQNGCQKIELEKADRLPGEESFDIILANINKNVILDNFSSLTMQLRSSGTLIISGLLKQDEKDLQDIAAFHHVKITQGFSQGEWVSLRINH